jgi:hypothetical protein
VDKPGLRLHRLGIDERRQLWSLWTIFLASLALELAILHLVPGRQKPWHPAQTAVAGFVLALLALPAAVSTFAMREKLREVRATPGPDSPSGVSGIRATLLALWARCLLIGFFGCLLAYGAASPRAAWPFVAAGAALLVFHAPRHWLFTRPTV